MSVIGRWCRQSLAWGAGELQVWSLVVSHSRVSLDCQSGDMARNSRTMRIEAGEVGGGHVWEKGGGWGAQGNPGREAWLRMLGL